MTGTTNTNASAAAPIAGLVVVHVRDAINPTLAGRGDASYQSPPQSREEALNLVALLLGRNEAPTAGEPRWTCPIAGGQRTVTLTPAPNGAEPTAGG
jgi:hypothetical protein